MGTVIAVTSGKGGTGKTACTAALASSLALLGHRTLCIDCDMGLRNLDMALGLTESLWDLDDVLQGRVPAEEAVSAHPKLAGLWFLAAPQELGPGDIDPERFGALLSELREVYDYILLDSPAGLGTGFQLAVRYADLALLTVNPDGASLRDGQRTAAQLRELGVPKLRLLINRVEPKFLKEFCLSLDDAIDAVGVQLIGVVSEEDAVPMALHEGEALMVYGARTAYPQFMRIARRLTGERVRIPKR